MACAEVVVRSAHSPCLTRSLLIPAGKNSSTGRIGGRLGSLVQSDLAIVEKDASAERRQINWVREP